MMTPSVFLVLVGTSWHLVNTIQCLQDFSNVTNICPTHLSSSSWCTLSFTPMLFQQKIINVLFISRWPNAGLQLGNKGPRANWHENMSCFNDNLMFVSAGRKLQATKHEPQNKNFETTTHQKHVKFRRHNSTRILMLGQPKPLKHIPPKHVTFRELCFGPIHAPWPIHDALDLFQLSHTSYNFRQTIVSR